MVTALEGEVNELYCLLSTYNTSALKGLKDTARSEKNKYQEVIFALLACPAHLVDDEWIEMFVV